MTKRLLAAALTAAILCTGAPVYAAEPLEAEVVQNAHAPYALGEFATVIEMTAKSGMYSEMTVKTDTYDKVVLHFSDNTLLMDTKTGYQTSETDIKAGDKVYVYYGETLALSEPPQVDALAVLVNLDEAHAPAHLLTAEQVQYNTDGSLTVTSEAGSVVVTLPADVTVTPLATRQVASLRDIHVGTRFFAWYDVVAMSMPGQATADKVVIPPQENYDLTLIKEGDIAFAQGRVESGVAMVPLRKVAEALGFTVTWNGEEESAHLTNGKVQTTVFIGEDSYFMASAQAIGMSAPQSLGAAAYEVNGTSWAPAELFTLLLGQDAVQLMGETLYFGGVMQLMDNSAS